MQFMQIQIKVCKAVCRIFFQCLVTIPLTLQGHNNQNGDSENTDLNLMMFGWLSFLRWRTSVSSTLRTFLTATGSSFSCPRKTAPWAPLPSQRRSDISSNGISQLPGNLNTNGETHICICICTCVTMRAFVCVTVCVLICFVYTV